MCVIFFFCLFFCTAQNSKLEMFNHLVSKTWKANGNWGDGSKFYQENTFNYALDSNIVIVKTIGFTNKLQTKIGSRNHGVRQFDKSLNKVLFWEFDIFGGLTKGSVYNQGKNIIYNYKYGNSEITDMWEYVNDSTYNFKVGNYKDGKWKQVYLNTTFNQVKQ